MMLDSDSYPEDNQEPSGAAIVCGYGIVKQFENDATQSNRIRTDTEMGGLFNYYSEVSNLINSYQISKVIFTGGFTNDNFPKLSESQTALDFFETNFMEQTTEGVSFYTETTSRTSHGNLYHGFIKIILTVKNYRKKKIYIFCDKPRVLKMKILAFCYFGMTFRYQVIGIEREDIHPNSNFVHQTLSGIKTVLSLGFWKSRFRLYSSMK